MTKELDGDATDQVVANVPEQSSGQLDGDGTDIVTAAVPESSTGILET